MDDLSNPVETPRADPHAGCCGGWGLDTPGYPIRHHIVERKREGVIAMHGFIVPCQSRY